MSFFHIGNCQCGFTEKGEAKMTEIGMLVGATSAKSLISKSSVDFQRAVGRNHAFTRTITVLASSVRLPSRKSQLPFAEGRRSGMKFKSMRMAMVQIHAETQPQCVRALLVKVHEVHRRRFYYPSLFLAHSFFLAEHHVGCHSHVLWLILQLDIMRIPISAKHCAHEALGKIRVRGRLSPTIRFNRIF